MKRARESDIEAGQDRLGRRRHGRPRRALLLAVMVSGALASLATPPPSTGSSVSGEALLTGDAPLSRAVEVRARGDGGSQADVFGACRVDPIEASGTVLEICLEAREAGEIACQRLEVSLDERSGDIRSRGAPVQPIEVHAWVPIEVPGHRASHEALIDLECRLVEAAPGLAVRLEWSVEARWDFGDEIAVRMR